MLPEYETRQCCGAAGIVDLDLDAALTTIESHAVTAD